MRNIVAKQLRKQIRKDMKLWINRVIEEMGFKERVKLGMRIIFKIKRK